jgi:hypothetical protein
MKLSILRYKAFSLIAFLFLMSACTVRYNVPYNANITQPKDAQGQRTPASEDELYNTKAIGTSKYLIY